MNFEIGQEWQLVNGETVTITQIDCTDGTCKTYSSDATWRDSNGAAEEAQSIEFDFCKLILDVADKPMQALDFSFRLHDTEIKDILARLKNNGYFDVLEFGKQVSLTTTRKLKEIL